MTHTPTVYAVKLRTFGGDALEAIAMVDDDGSLTVVTDEHRGYWSAHASCASGHFNDAVPIMTHDHKYVDAMGKKRVMTCWDRR